MEVVDNVVLEVKLCVVLVVAWVVFLRGIFLLVLFLCCSVQVSLESTGLVSVVLALSHLCSATVL